VKRLKPVIFIGGSKSTIKRFPEEARGDSGWQLQAVQNGKDPTDWKPMPSIGPGVKEIRVHRPHEHRVIYTAHFPEAVYVLHAFEKKTQQTPQRHIDIARSAYAEVKTIRTKKRTNL
jgi:phage-related protein